MEIQAGVGLSHHRDPRVAGQEAANKALKAGGIEKPDFVFMFAAVGYDQQALLKAVREATAGAPLCGCSAWGVITAEEADESSFSVAVMTIRSDQLRFSNGIATGLKEDPAQAAREIAKAIQPEIKPDTLALFMFPEGRSMNFDRLMAGLEEHLNLDQLLPLVGGSAGDDGSLECTYQYCNDQVFSDGLAYALLSGQAQVAWAVSQGCVPLGLECKVTRSEGNVIYEIDGRSVLEFYKDYLTEDELKDPMKVALTFYFGFKAPGHLAGHEEYIIREMTGDVDQISTGPVTLSTEVAEGTTISLARRDYEELAHGVDRVADEIKTQLGDNPARLIFQFDCAARGSRLYLREQQKLELLQRLRRKIGLDVPWMGFYTFGEIGPLGGQNFWHNMAIVLVAIY